jgi:hypothetical protein
MREYCGSICITPSFVKSESHESGLSGLGELGGVLSSKIPTNCRYIKTWSFYAEWPSASKHMIS